MKIQSALDINDMARGAVFLGAGGGGDPSVGELFVKAQLKAGNAPDIIHVDDLADDAFVLSIALMGAPTVMVENLISVRALLELAERSEAFYGRRPDALISIEMGGANSMFPIGLGARLGLPIVDGDGMGRAFPHIEMTTFSVYGVHAAPLILLDDLGNEVRITATQSDLRAEQLARANCGAMGGLLVGSFYPMSGADAKRTTVRGTITETLTIGRVIREARLGSLDPVSAVVDQLNRDGRHARLLFEGKITDVSHETRDGWHWGKATIDAPDGRQMIISIQNEYIVARVDGRTVAVVPDLIVTLDRESAEPLTAEMLRYGHRVAVVGYSAAEIMRRPEGLAVFGPRQFGLDEDFVRIEELIPA